jgi:hypothetical protein
MTWDVLPWQEHPVFACSAAKALTFAIVEWPSGRKTVEQGVATAVISSDESRTARSVEGLKAAKLFNLEKSIEEWQRRTAVNGWWIRTKRRPKARRVLTVTWVRPSHYDGPAADRGGALPT